MTRIRFLFVLACLVLAASFPAAGVPVYGTLVGAGDYSGSRSVVTSGPGLEGVGLWDPAGSVTVQWSISFNPVTQLYNYSYNVSATRNISHFIIELSDFCVNPNVTACAADAEGLPAGVFGTYSNSTDGNSNAELPNGVQINGVKFSGGGQQNVSVSFTSTQAPVWGHVFVRDGLGHAAYNTGMLNITSANVLDFIARPDGDFQEEEIPEPGTYVLIGAGLVALALTRRKAAA